MRRLGFTVALTIVAALGATGGFPVVPAAAATSGTGTTAPRATAYGAEGSVQHAPVPPLTCLRSESAALLRYICPVCRCPIAPTPTRCRA